MDIDGDELCHLLQNGLIGSGSDHLQVGKFSSDVQLSSNYVGHHTDPGYATDENVKLVPMYLSENGWGDPGIMEFDVSGMIFNAREGRNVCDSDFLWFRQYPGIHSFDFGNCYDVNVWLQSKSKFSGHSVIMDSDTDITLAATEEFVISSIQGGCFHSQVL